MLGSSAHNILGGRLEMALPPIIREGGWILGCNLRCLVRLGGSGNIDRVCLGEPQVEVPLEVSVNLSPRYSPRPTMVHCIVTV